MMRVPSVSFFLRRRPWLTLLIAAAMFGLADTGAPAQDAGVSGIPPGPANARGVTGAVSDPSGIGNAAKVPAIPPPTITPVMPPTVATPSVARPYSPTAVRPYPVQRAAPARRTRSAARRLRAKASDAAIKEKNTLSGRGLTSICRGC